MTDLKPGETVEVPGSGDRMYTLKNTDGTYSCSCPAWKRQRNPPLQRTCKHLKRFRGEDVELDRIAFTAQKEPDIALPQVLVDSQEIADVIKRLKENRRIWLDTETADPYTNGGRLRGVEKPRTNLNRRIPVRNSQSGLKR